MMEKLIGQQKKKFLRNNDYNADTFTLADNKHTQDTTSIEQFNRQAPRLEEKKHHL
jgi:hypothetical protein